MEIVKLKKEIMLAVKHKLPIFLFIIPLIVTMGCSMNKKSSFHQTYNKGNYTITRNKSENLYKQGKILISGEIKGIGASNDDIYAVIKYGCLETTSNNGEYKFILKEKSDQPLQFTAVSIGHLTVETAPMKLELGDSINLNFMLAEDERPLINCEGVNN